MLYRTPQQMAPPLSHIYFSPAVCFHPPRAFVGLSKSAHRAAVSIPVRRDKKGESSLWKVEITKIFKHTQRNTNTMKSLEELEHQLNPLSVKEAARIFGECTATFYQRIRRGEVPGIIRDKTKPKARIKICPKEFVPWLRSQLSHGNGNNGNNNGNDNGNSNGGKEGKVA